MPPNFPAFPGEGTSTRGPPGPSQHRQAEPKGGLHSDVFSVSHWNCRLLENTDFHESTGEACSLGQEVCPGMFANTFGCMVDNRDFVSNNADILGSSLVVQWLRLCVPNSRSMGSIPSEGTKIPHATGHSQSMLSCCCLVTKLCPRGL